MEAPQKPHSRSSRRLQEIPDTSVVGLQDALPITPLHDQPTRVTPPTPRLQTDISTTRSVMADPYGTAGQFTYAPATQQTTVTTTTTTTVSLAPLFIKPPHDLSQRDPKQYPLAFSPTPHAMTDFGFEFGGQKTRFQEAANPGDLYRSHMHQRAAARIGDGSTTQEKQLAGSASQLHLQASTRQNYPPSLAEAAELASYQRRRKRPRAALYTPVASSENVHLAHAHPPRAPLDHTKSMSPVTPGTGAGGPSRIMKLHEADGDINHDSLDDVTREERQGDLHDQGEGFGALKTSRPPMKMPRLRSISPSTTGSLSAEQEQERFDPRTGATATPPILDTDLEPVMSEVMPSDVQRQRRPQPPRLVETSQQDASLPSPSLSPVTAAANLARSQMHSLTNRFHDDETDSEVSGLDLDESAHSRMALSRLTMGNALERHPTGPTGVQTLTSRKLAQPTIMDVPTMVNAFDSLPDELQNYVMFHMLKRCSKKTLQTVADVVNPALKCDPFDVLPTELGLQITKFLDSKSLSSASQVSKRWRHLINSDETAWRDLLVRDGFTLPQGEIQRAIREGWGWQFAGPTDAEVDLSKKDVRPVSRQEIDSLGISNALSSDDGASNTSTRMTRLKRKATSQPAGHKKSKRSATGSRRSSITYQASFETARGPVTFAGYAARAVPDPHIGLPSLANLHLFKSIYQRHYMIRNSWMDQEVRPHHLAFRAHHRHVVTCLIFDSDRIITGSDDTSINVYDTKTGVLRKRLEGHEGGVWALNCDGNTLVSGSTDRSVRVWDITTGKCLQTFQGHTSTVRCLVILKPTKIGEEYDGVPIMAPEEPIIITGSRDSTLRVWKLPNIDDPSIHQAGPSTSDSANPYALRTLSGHHNSVRAIAAHGDTLVSGSYDCSVRVWKISNGELLHRLTGHAQKVYSVVLDHARGRCISGSMDNLVKVWSLETGMCLFNLEGHTSLVGLLDLSHGRLVSAAADSTLRIWDPENGLCRSTLSAHTGAITCFQHDGQKVISGSDRTLKMWDVETGECVRDLLTDLSGVWQVRFDERRCVAAVQRNSLTYIEVLDFGASRDGIPPTQRGHRIVVNEKGRQIVEENDVIEPPAPPSL